MRLPIAETHQRFYLLGFFTVRYDRNRKPGTGTSQMLDVTRQIIALLAERFRSIAHINKDSSIHLLHYLVTA
jgi:hypothetical protein